MAAPGMNIKGCVVQVYDKLDYLVMESTVSSYDAKLSEIELSEFAQHPDLASLEEATGLKDGATYRVRVMCLPVPYEYTGTARLKGGYRVIVLYRGEISENRHNPRFKVDASASIVSLVYDNKAYVLLSPLEVRIVNVSQSGVRFSAKHNTMSLGDSFELILPIGGVKQSLLAKVMNCVDVGPEATEYGCSFLAKGREIERVE